MAERIATPIEVALVVGDALDAVGIGYFLGGSLASSMQGQPRATNDIDLVVDLRPEQVGPLAARLGPTFDVDEDALREAARERTSWNVFHVPSALRIDLFVRRETPYDRVEFERRRREEIAPGRHLWVKSAEDSVLRKLLWFREGGETSQRQWRDVVEILRTSGPLLDEAYLRTWAAELDVEPLLAHARAEAAL